MAFFDRFKKAPEDGERKIENDYEVGITADERKAKTTKARKRGRNILIALGVAAVFATIALPFAIGLAVTATGVSAATLTAFGVTAAIAAIGIDVAFVGAWVASRTQRRKAKTARRLETQSKRTFNNMDRSETKDMLSKIREIVDTAEINAKAGELDAVHTRKGVKFVGVDKDLVAVWSAEPLTDDEKQVLMDAESSYAANTGHNLSDLIRKFENQEPLTDVEKQAINDVQTSIHADKQLDLVKRFELNRDLTSDEKLKLAQAMRPDDAAVKKIFGNATVSYKYPYQYEKMEITPSGADAITVDLSGISAKTLQAHKIYEQQLGNLVNGIRAEATLDFYTADSTIKNRYQRAILNDRTDASGAVISAEKNASTVLATTVAAKDAKVFG